MTDTTSRPLFLPIDARKASAFFRDGQLPLSSIERAALMGAMTQLGNPMSHVALERLIAAAEQQFTQDPAAGEQYLTRLREGSATLQPREVFAGLAKSGVTYAPAEMMAGGAWRSAAGGYDFGFQDVCRAQMEDWEVLFEAPGTGQASEDEFEDEPRQPRTPVRFRGLRDQGVAARVIAAGGDEHVVVNAYAGTGKTHLIHTLASSLGRGVTYIAPYAAHLYGFMTHSAGDGSQVRRTTLWELAHTMSRAHARELKMGHAPRSGSSLLTPEQQASLAGIESIDNAGAALTMQRARAIVSSWCHTTAPTITEKHVLRYVPHCSPGDLPRYIAASERLWKAMINTAPKGGHAFDINIYHLAKWLVISGARIPTSAGLLLVDEAHDLRAAWRHLFHTYEGGCVLLGDPNQHLKGNPHQVTGVKLVSMSHSVRMGLGVESLVQSTLEMDPTGLIPDSFTGSREHITRQRRYCSRNEAPTSGLHVYGSEWSLLEDALQLQLAGASFRLLPASLSQLERLTKEAVAMRRGDSYRGVRHNAEKTWSALMASLERQGLKSLIARFERGLSTHDLSLLRDAQAEDGAQTVTLGLIEHAKNLEANRVVLRDCCFDVQLGQRSYMPSRAAYLAITRARHEVWMPGDALDRLTVLQQQHC